MLNEELKKLKQKESWPKAIQEIVKDYTVIQIDISLNS